jgi:hypothetical protein
MALIGAVVGAMNGLGFAMMLLVAERRSTFETLRLSRVGTWGAVATGGVVGLLFQSLPVALGAAAIGFLGAAGSLALARRAAVPGVSPDEPPALPR